MAEHPNIARIRDGYAAFAKGDFAVLTDLFAEELLWHDSGWNQLSGDYRGRESVFGLFGKLTEVRRDPSALAFMHSSPTMSTPSRWWSSRPAEAAGASRSTKRTSSTCATAR